MKSLHEKCHGKKHLYIVWHDCYSNKGFLRKPLGLVETKDEMRTRIRIMERLFIKEKMPPMEGGRNNISLTLADAERDPVVACAELGRRF